MSASAAAQPVDVTLWDVETAAAASGLSPRSVRHLIEKRLIPTVKVGRLVRIRPSDFEAFIAANTRPATDTDR